MQIHPRIETGKLKLRPFAADDAPLLAELAGSRDIADTMISIPHPFSPAIARSTIAGNAAGFQAGHSVSFAIEEKLSASLVGCIELRELDTEHSQAELSFWIGRPAWGQGYATEAVQAVVRFAFASLELNRVYAYHMVRNPASGAVLTKAGMKQEGVLRERVKKWDTFEDVAVYAILRSDTSAV